jgi:hypothetical protein
MLNGNLEGFLEVIFISQFCIPPSLSFTISAFIFNVTGTLEHFLVVPSLSEEFISHD